VPDAYDLAIFENCTPDEFVVANERFLVTRQGGVTGYTPHPYWNVTGSGRPGSRFYTQECEGNADYEGTVLCQSLATE